MTFIEEDNISNTPANKSPEFATSLQKCSHVHPSWRKDMVHHKRQHKEVKRESNH